MQKLKYEEMRPAELAEARERVSLVYVPIGSTEYHGYHLPVGFDAMHAYELCFRAAQQTGGVVLPSTYWGTTGHDAFPGSLLLNEETIAVLMRDVLVRLTEQHYRLIVLCTGHYPAFQGKLLEELATEHMTWHPAVNVIVLDPLTIHPTDPRSEHAGRIETSVMLHLRPDLVDMAQLQKPGALEAISQDCVDATAEYGQERLEAVLAEAVRMVKEALAGI